jgi:hypothetical protein
MSAFATAACCAYSADWPRFSLNGRRTGVHPDALVAVAGRHAREGYRCAALTGEVGVATSWASGADRPRRRECQPGDARRMARAGASTKWPPPSG